MSRSVDGYVGIDINRGARISAAGHGGQVLVSTATRGLVGEALPDGVAWRDLGTYRLRDFPEPERLSQLVIDGLPADFPALRTADARPNNLPSTVTSFVGRERELTEARLLLQTARLLTVTGLGGIGKTRFAIELAHRAGVDFPDGTFFVPFEPVDDPVLVPGTIAQAVGIVEIGARQPVQLLKELLGGQRVLLVLDNFERLTAAASVIGDLLRAAPGLRFVVTSRAILHLSGEQEFPLDGLTVPPDIERLNPSELVGRTGTVARATVGEGLLTYSAVRLFVERAMAARPSFSLDASNAAIVARICARLDGSPLAIELAAARIRLLPPDAILTRLERQFELLASSARDVPERQRTLRGAIAWSYDLLAEPHRHLLERLACFIGGCDLETAERVCGPTDELGVDVFDGIAELADQSLVRRSEAGDDIRFTIPETIRQFAYERLQARGETDEIRRRHAEAFLDLARAAAAELSGADQRRWVERLEREHDNMRAALAGRSRRQPLRSRSGSPSPSGGSGRNAVTSSRPGAGSRRSEPSRGRRRILSPTPGSSRRSAASPTGRATSRARSGRTGPPSTSGASSATAPRSRTPSTTWPSPTTSTRTASPRRTSTT